MKEQDRMPVQQEEQVRKQEHIRMLNEATLKMELQGKSLADQKKAVKVRRLMEK